MRTLTGRDVVAQLIRAYEEEAKLYEGLEDSAAEQHHLLLNGRNPDRMAELVERQRALAEQIGRIEAGIAPLREYWERIRDSTRDAHVQDLADGLDTLLEQLVERIHTIVEIEKENSRVLLRDSSTIRV